MAIFKCKMCGGTLEVMDGATTGECQYCGTTQTLPKLNDDKKANMYDRANHFRRNNEFDKARAIYEQILNEDNTDAESYWSIILCQYGIEYVEDPVTHKRVPTVNRAQFTSVFADENYKKAIEHADVYQKSIYEEEAKAIDEIQKGILAISQKEEPFDVFICYKETDNNGRRTPDSVLANDLYHQLTQEGFKVFFSRITLEDKLGSAYEPYIFAALNSAKVMVVVGTKPEYFNAVWVKNEWSRYLSLIKSGANKILIPAYRDMDPYDLPEEFSHLQAQDMSKLGFMQDLIRGIKKLAGAETKVEQSSTVVTQVAPQSNVEPLLKRAFMFLEDFDWKSADEYAERVLDIDPENGQAYLCKFLAANRVRAIDGIKESANSPMSKPIATKALRFLDEKTKQELNEACEYNEKNVVYLRALDVKQKGASQWDMGLLTESIKMFEGVLSFKDSKQQIEKCQSNIEKIRKRNAEKLEAERRAEEERLEAERKAEEERIRKEKDEKYNNAVDIVDLAKNKTPDVYRSAIAKLDKIRDWKDSERLIAEYTEEVVKLEELIKKKKAKSKKIAMIVSPFIVTAIAVALVFTNVIIPSQNYAKGVEAFEKGEWLESAAYFHKAKGKENSEEYLRKICSDFSLKIDNGFDITVGLKSDGTVVATGNNDVGECNVEGWKDIIAVSAGYDHTVGLKADGTVVAVGENEYDECNVEGWKDIIAVSAGSSHTVGLKSDGTVVATEYIGFFYHGECNVEGWKDIIAVSAGSIHTVGLKSDGTVVATGNNDDGQCNVEGWKDIIAVSAGENHTVGLKSDGTVVATGSNAVGECNVEGWKDIIAVSAGFGHTVGLKSDGTVVATEYKGYYYDGQCNVKGWNDIIAVSAGFDHTVGLKADGTVVAVGANEDGQCDVEDWNLLL